jgi:RNA polymerase sigma-70 factor (ECF subfamily)
MNIDRPAEPDRFLALLRPLERDLEVYCRRLIWDPEDVPDAVQNAVLRAWSAFDRYREEASFRVWMFRILTREIFALNRKYARIARFEFKVEPEEMAALAVTEPIPEETDKPLSVEALESVLDQSVVMALKTLTETERAVLLLRAIGGFRYREIGESLEIPLGSVMGNLARARQKMRRATGRSRIRLSQGAEWSSNEVRQNLGT